jgi:hypothetical protein
MNVGREPGAQKREQAETRVAREERARLRRKNIVAHVARDWSDADDWDLEFWFRQTPQQRLSALVALRDDLRAVRGADAAID